MLRHRQTETTGTCTSSEESPSKKSDFRKTKKIRPLKYLLRFVAVIAIVLYIIVPLVFYLSPTVRRHAIFLNYFSLSQYKNLSDPTEVGLNCTRHFYIRSENNIHLGTWHIPSQDTLSQCKQGLLKEEEEFSDSAPVFLYLHGNAGTRGGNHRVQLYKVLTEKVNAHVVAFDYRGYGDSSNLPPSADGLVTDTSYVYDWLKRRVGHSRIYVWGHSLGTGVATAFLETLFKSKYIPAGLVLEAPFTKLVDEVRHHPLSFLHRYMPFFDFFFTDPVGGKETEFDSTKRIGKVKCPLLILHAEDDGFVPYRLGQELYKKALADRPSDLYPAQFIGFDGKLDYGHKHIYKNPSLPSIIKQFMENAKNNFKV